MADELVLYDFSEPVPPELLEMRQTSTRLTDEGALEIVFQPGTPWPGITLKAPEGKWDLRPYQRIGLDIRNTGAKQARVGFRVDNPGADGNKHCLQQMIDIIPGGMQRLDISYNSVSGEMTVELFGMRGYPVEVNGGMRGQRTIDAGNVIQVLVFMASPKETYSIEIDNIKASGWRGAALAERPVFNNDNFFPFIDTYGQFIHRDWPGKVNGPEDIEAHRVAEEKELAAMPGPADWNQWGGWAAGPQLNATGFFRTEKYADKWWLVDPDGRLFFSHGLDCVGENGSTPIDDRETWFRDFPGDKEEFKNCFGRQDRVVNGYYRGKKPRMFDFGRANNMRKYGENWKAKSSDVAHRRLRSWGINTIANWSDANIYLQKRTPYFVNVGAWGAKALEGSVGYWGKFSDVYDPSFRQAIEKGIAQQRGKSVDDPWCIGYFVHNELSWGDVTSLAVGALLSPPEQAAKIELLKVLRAQYADIQALNAAWETSFVSWEAMSANRDEVKLNDVARQDLRVFNRAFTETYFRTVRDALKAVAPNQLYAGCRFAWVNDDAADIAGAYCDIVCYNLYRRDVSSFKYPGSRDVPLIIGEFHFGALDRGMFHTGLVPTESQEARAEAYKNYVLGVLRHRNFVGCHWFKYMDQATTGRGLDEENYQIGFVDIVDTPYPETIAASREVGYSLYEYRLKGGGEKK